eukprot:226179-Prymnesium_polylepis.3
MGTSRAVFEPRAKSARCSLAPAPGSLLVPRVRPATAATPGLAGVPHRSRQIRPHSRSWRRSCTRSSRRRVMTSSLA